MWVTVLLTFQQSGLSEQDNEYFTFTYLSMDLIHSSNCVHFMGSWTICPLHFAQVLEGRAYRLQHPWVGVVNRSQQDINKNVDMIAARRRERDYFAQSPDYGHLSSRMGSEYLGKLLSKVPFYINHLVLARVQLNLCIVHSSALLFNLWGQPASDSCPCQNTNCSNHEVSTLFHLRICLILGWFSSVLYSWRSDHSSLWLISGEMTVFAKVPSF